MATRKTKAAPTTEAPTDTKVIAYKGFDKGLKCRDFQFEIGKTYTHDGSVKACASGFHSCENPFDVWSYYGPADGNRFALIEASGEISRHGDDSKLASAKLSVNVELTLPEFIKRGVKYLLSLTKDVVADVSAASGYASQLAASGNASQLAASGDASKLAASGYASKLAASGDASKLAASGDASQLAASGNASQLAASGYASKLAASGDASIAMSAGYESHASAGSNGVIALTYWDGSRPRVAVGYVGENGIKPNVSYRVVNGALVEV